MPSSSICASSETSAEPFISTLRPPPSKAGPAAAEHAVRFPFASTSIISVFVPMSMMIYGAESLGAVSATAPHTAPDKPHESPKSHSTASEAHTISAPRNAPIHGGKITSFERDASAESPGTTSPKRETGVKGAFSKPATESPRKKWSIPF